MKAPPAPLWILSNNPRLHSTRRLLVAARGMGVPAVVVPPSAIQPVLGTKARVLVAGRELPRGRAVLPRVGSNANRMGVHAVRQLELLGMPSVNPSEALQWASDKWATAQRLWAARVPVPAAALLRPDAGLDAALEAVGGLPVVLKLLRGSHGVGVFLCRTRAELLDHVQALWAAGQDVLLQAYVAEAEGRDVRAFVVGDRVVAAMERRAATGEFRANVHLGASTQPLKLERAVGAVALRAARALQLGVAGVDLLMSAEGPLVLEVNASPGLRGIEAATGVDVAGAIVSHAGALGGAAQRVQRPVQRS